ncbi:MAG: UDP-N-acetylglucosamine 1-carboxyvinyltransferase [Cyanothece sp. SIO2G6]|nr:UDP-N-acetylglucosamine 1-carboxyvinyltransferase [Cyanothece sp. SIO2G6]
MPPAVQESVLNVVGGYPLSGQVRVSGAKNSALVLMAASLLCPQELCLRNVPNLADVERMAEIIRSLGASVVKADDSLLLNASNIGQSSAPYDLVSQLRASFFAIGPIVARLGEAKMPLPGGCAIGARPVDLHVRGLRALGADVQIDHGIVHAYVRGQQKRLTGARIYLDCPSVGATETLMMAATLAEGETIIENAAQEPEVVDLANFCCSMGAKIRGAGTKTIVISGVRELHATDYGIVPDRIEAGTFLVAGAITHSSDFTLTPVVPAHLTAVMTKLRSVGAEVSIEAPNTMRVVSSRPLTAVDIETLPFPGFPTDMQAQFMALLTLSEGNSVITETVFENRLRHVAELNRMGADIRVKGNIAVVRGVPFLSGAPVLATDLRASAALVIAGLAAQGTTQIRGLHHLDRGYEKLEDKLRNLGACIERANIDVEPDGIASSASLTNSPLDQPAPLKP